MIVGTSTNCSTINGSDRAAREGQDDDEEIMGTLITCSATGKSKRRKNSSTLSTICGTGASRICTIGASSEGSSTKCRSTRPCGCTSTRSAGRIPGGGEVASVPVGLGAPRGLPPLWLWCLASVPVGRRSAAHCGVPQLPEPWRRWTARAARHFAAAAHAASPRLPRRVQPSWTRR